MAKGAYVGVDNIARKIKKGYIGVDGVARKIKKAYIGIGGVARPCWGGGLEYYGTITPLSYARNELAATHVGNHAVFAGGVYVNSSGRTNYKYVDAYDTSLTRTSPTALDYGAMYLSAASIGNYAIFAGGYYANSSGDPTYGTYAYAYDSSLVKTLAPSIAAYRKEIGAATVGDYALFAGGETQYGGTSQYSDKVDAYNSSLTITYKTIGVARTEMGSAPVGNYALFAGGRSYSNMYGVDRVDAFDAALTLSTATGLSKKRTISYGTSVGNYALFAGGYSDTATEDGYFIRTVDSYNASLTRGIAPDLSNGRQDAAATSLGNYALIGGGHNNSQNRVLYTNVDVYDESLTHTMADGLSKGRYGLAATTVGNYALFGGGYDGSNRYADVDAYVAG